MCISQNLTCDGVNHCGDNSDETSEALCGGIQLIFLRSSVILTEVFIHILNVGLSRRSNAIYRNCLLVSLLFQTFLDELCYVCITNISFLYCVIHNF